MTIIHQRRHQGVRYATFSSINLFSPFRVVRANACQSTSEQRMVAKARPDGDNGRHRRGHRRLQRCPSREDRVAPLTIASSQTVAGQSHFDMCVAPTFVPDEGDMATDTNVEERHRRALLAKASEHTIEQLRGRMHKIREMPAAPRITSPGRRLGRFTPSMVWSRLNFPITGRFGNAWSLPTRSRWPPTPFLEGNYIQFTHGRFFAVN